jgi:trk system potassium uptake protein TrkA
MHVVIIGAGEVGTSIADSLDDSHDVVVIDVDEARAEELTYGLDVMTLAGDGTHSAVLREADIESADMLIASTDDDRTNLVACGTATALADPFTIARTKSVEYLSTWKERESAFGVDFMVCSDLASAENIVRVVGLPAAIDVDPFAGGQVQMAVFEILGDSPVAGQTVADADRFDALTFAGLFRDGEMILPHGETPIRAGDRAVVIGSPESVQGFATDLAPEATPDEATEIVIFGGSEIGYHTARLLERRGLKPRLIEQDPDRARYLAEELPDTLVLEHDATDTEFLAREPVAEADIVVASLDSDEKNMLVSVLSKQLGTDRAMAVVDSASYVPLFEEIGTDVAINPRSVTAEEITRFTHESVAENISVLDQAEVLELELSADSPLVGRPIQDIASEVDADFVVGAVTRARDYVTTRGDTTLEAGDHVVVFVETPFVEDLLSMA